MSSRQELESSIQTPDEPDPRLGSPGPEERRRAEIDARGGLRHRAARGTIVNAAFLMGLTALGLLKGFVVAAFLTTSEYGVWGILLITVTALLTLKQVGISDKYVQQDEPDQEHAFQRAFTNELIITAAVVGALLALLPVVVLAYGDSDLLLPGLVLGLAIPGVALQAPIWIFYRRMQFVRQRTLQAIDPVVSFALTVALAVAGYGYWSLVIGTVVGSWIAALAALISSPYRPALRYERESLRDYVSFSWPLMIAPLSGIAIAQGSLLVADLTLGLAGAGAIALTAQLSLYTTKLDEVVTQTLYPAINVVKNRLDTLREAFLTSNRMAMLWGVPFGVGVATFAGDLITFGIGEEWRPAQTLIEITALSAGASQLGFNWNAFLQAKGDTRPVAVGAGIMVAAMALIALPLLALDGLTGFAVGLAIATCMLIATRVFYLLRLFPRLPILRNAFAAVLPTLPAAVTLLLWRSLDGDRNGVEALAQLAVFVGIVLVATLILERQLVRESLRYLRRPAAA